MVKLKEGSHIHLMGICGTAMASLAALLHERGFRVTGSDQNVYPPMSTFLQERGIEIMKGYRAENLQPAPDFVVVGNVMTKKYEESQALLQSSIPYGSLPETLRDYLIQDRHSLVVCGTHGKTTTTSMAAWVANQAGLKPGFLVGGIPKNFDSSFQYPKGNWFVIEGDEYDSAFFAKVPKFSFYKPKTAILSGIEFDHADIYPDLQAVEQAFAILFDKLSTDGLLVHSASCPSIKKLLPRYSGKKVSYGNNVGDWQVQDLKILREGLKFNVVYKGRREETLEIPMWGRYNALNALAVVIVAKEWGWSVDLSKALQSFRGVKRRQELLGEWGGVQVIEDFAHHPTAVLETLKSLNQREGAGRVIALFEPRSATSRRNYFQHAYYEALKESDICYVCRPYDATQLGDQAMDTGELVKQLVASGIEAHEFVEHSEILSPLVAQVQSGDTIVVMSNGSFQGIYDSLATELERRRSTDSFSAKI